MIYVAYMSAPSNDQRRLGLEPDIINPCLCSKLGVDAVPFAVRLSTVFFFRRRADNERMGLAIDF